MDVLGKNCHPTHSIPLKQPSRDYSDHIKFIFESNQIIIYVVQEDNEMLQGSFNRAESSWTLGCCYIMSYSVIFPGQQRPPRLVITESGHASVHLLSNLFTM